MILDRIKAYIDYKNITISAFEKSLGMSNASFSKSLKSGKGIGTDKLENILNIYSDISPEWLLTGEGPMLIVPLRERISYILSVVGPDLCSLYLEVDKFKLINCGNGGAEPSDKLNFDLFLQKYPNFNPLWLKKGIDDNKRYIMGTKEENEKAIKKQIEEKHVAQNNEIINAHLNQPTINEERKGSPYYSVDFIGGFDWVENDQTRNPDFYINYPPYNKDGVVWVNLTGHSMEPEISNGDIIALRPMETPIEHLPTREIYAIVTDEYRTVKRIEMSDREGFIRLLPSNPEYKAQEIPIDMITKVYAVLGSIRKFF